MQITDEKLDGFHNSYRGSADEGAELLQFYERFEGNMGMVFEFLPCSEPAVDSHRFMDAVDAAIADGRAQVYKRYTKWRRATAKKDRPKDPLKPKTTAKKRAAADSDAALVAAIRNKVRQATPVPRTVRRSHEPAASTSLLQTHTDVFPVALQGLHDSGATLAEPEFGGRAL